MGDLAQGQEQRGLGGRKWQSWQRRALAAQQGNSRQAASSDERVWQGGWDAQSWAADRVAFLNDVYFCAGDVLRLLRHDADLACGLDFDRPALRQMPPNVSLTQTASSALRPSDSASRFSWP